MFDLPSSRKSLLAMLPSFCTKKVAIGFWAVVYLLSIRSNDFTEVSRDVRRMLLGEQDHDLPPIYWINLDRSTERKDVMTGLFSTLGISDVHRVSASNVETTTQMLQEGRLVFHPQVRIEEDKDNRKSIYAYKEAACLLSHLDAIKQAYNDGHELALILEDDAKITHKFQREWRDYVAWRAPRGWKVLQMATINPRVMEQGVNLIDRFISWQPWHYSTRAYFINRSGMETLMQKSHSLTASGESVWRIDESPMVVADEVVYANIGDSYTSTSLWVDSMELPSTVQDDDEWATSTLSDSYAPYIDLEKEKDERFDEAIEKSLLVLTRATFSEEREMVETMRHIEEDYHAVCRFHQLCKWEVDVDLTDPALMAAFDELSSRAASNIHFHVTRPSPSEKPSDISRVRAHVRQMEDTDTVFMYAFDKMSSVLASDIDFRIKTDPSEQSSDISRVRAYVRQMKDTDAPFMAVFDKISSKLASNIDFRIKTDPSEQSSSISHILNHVDRMEDYDLVLLKDVKQRINGFPWKSFVERRGDAIVSGPLRQRLEDVMLGQGKVIRQVNIHEAFPWNRTAKWAKWSNRLFANVIPTEVPVLERYFVLFDAKFARYFFNLIAMPKFANSLSEDDPELLWCQAAKMWDNSRPGCYLIPVVSKDESDKEDQHEMNDQSPSISGTALVNDQTFAEAIKCSLQWKDLINSPNLIASTCNQLIGIDQDNFDLQTCAMHFYSDQCRPSIETIQ